MTTSTITIQPFQPEHLPQLRDLINLHVEAIVPGWALADDYIHARLQSNPGQYVIDPWVAERQTVCAISRDRVVAAARPVYELLGAAGNLEVSHPDCEHDFPDEMSEKAYGLIDRVLKDEAARPAR